jgi:EsV-1-7 cysteine-rich motif
MSQRRKSATGRKDTRIRNRCQDPACTGVEASYGFVEDQKRVRCFKHKADGMKLIFRPTCGEPACATGPGFGWPGTKVSIALVLHTISSNETRCYKFDLYITCCGVTRADALSCTCKPILQERLFCFKHKLEGMIAILADHATCRHDGCVNKSTWGFDSDKASTRCNCVLLQIKTVSLNPHHCLRCVAHGTAS